MKKTTFSASLLTTCLAFAFSFAPLGVHAQAAKAATKPAPKAVAQLDPDEARPVNGDTRLVVFNYDTNLVYNILTQDGMMTHIELAPGERVQGFYLSDATRWKHLVSQDKSRVFIKPSMPGVENSATMVTTARVYELRFKSGVVGEPWYQRVRWAGVDIEFPGAATFEGVSEFARSPGRSAVPTIMQIEPAGAISAGMTSGRGAVPTVQADKLNFGYDISGSASFRPVMVFDDGKFTWIQLNENPSMPALFMANERGGLEIVNYTVHGNYLMISQVVPGIVLRLGNEEVKITRKGQSKCVGFWCSK